MMPVSFSLFPYFSLFFFVVVILLLFIFTKILLLLLFYFVYLFFLENYFIFSCFGMFRNVPCSRFYRRPVNLENTKMESCSC